MLSLKYHCLPRRWTQWSSRFWSGPHQPHPSPQRIANLLGCYALSLLGGSNPMKCLAIYTVIPVYFFLIHSWKEWKCNSYGLFFSYFFLSCSLTLLVFKRTKMCFCLGTVIVSENTGRRSKPELSCPYWVSSLNPPWVYHSLWLSMTPTWTHVSVDLAVKET